MDDAPETAVPMATMKRRAAVIGAGTAGIATAWALRHYTDCEVVVFERYGNVGGLWLFDDPLTGSKTSMYEELRVNIPLRMMPFPAYMHLPPSFKPEETDFPYRPVFQEYLEIAAKELGVTEVTQFGTSVAKVEKQGAQWNVAVEKDGVSRSEIFDDVIVCNGHHAARLMPPEMKEVFPLLGKDERFVHSADYRSSAPFRGCRNVLVVGAASSAMDISLLIAEAAEKVTMLVRPTSKMLQLPIGKKVEVITELKDPGEYDGAVLCTGYAVHLPFLPQELRDTSELRLHTFSKDIDNLFFVGLPQKVPPAGLYQLQGMVVAGVIAGKIRLPESAAFGPRRFESDSAAPEMGLPEEPCQIGSHEFYLEEKLRLRHEIETEELPGLWNAYCDLIAQMDGDAARRLRKSGEALMAVYLEALRRRASGGLGNESIYRNDKLRMVWNDDGSADTEWL